MPFSLDERIGDIALAFPRAIPLFDRHGLDYCCGGQRSLRSACEVGGHSPAEILARLEALATGGPALPAGETWTAAPLEDLVDHLVSTHHAFTREVLDRIAPLAAKVARVHGGRHPELTTVEALFRALDRDLRPHLEKEERILFPYIRALGGGASAASCFGTVANPLRVMQMEHEAAGDLLRRLRRVTRDYELPEDACTTWRALYNDLQSLEADLHRHIHLGTNVLFPRALDAEARLA